MPTETNSLKAS